MRKKLLAFNWDFLGITTSLLCAVHCAILPILATLSVFSTGIFVDDHFFETFMILMAIVIASISLINGYIKVHKSILPVIIFTSAVFIMLLGHFLFTEDLSHVINAIGGVCIAIAHWINWKKLRRNACKISTPA